MKNDCYLKNKRKEIIFIVTLIFIYSLSECLFAKEIQFQFDAGWRSINDQLYTAVYNKKNIEYGTAIVVEIYKGFGIKAEGNYFYNKGHTTVLSGNTRLQIITGSLGILYQFRILKLINPYVCVSGTYSMLLENVVYAGENNGNDFRNNGFGFQVEMGSLIKIFHWFGINLNFKYSKDDHKVGDISLNLGGLRWSGGISFIF